MTIRGEMGNRHSIKVTSFLNLPSSNLRHIFEDEKQGKGLVKGIGRV